MKNRTKLQVNRISNFMDLLILSASLQGQSFPEIQYYRILMMQKE